MSFANTELRISELRISNFRKFDSYSIDFDQQLTVLVGDNGTGKSTLIDAVCVALGTLFHKIEHAKSLPVSPDDARGAVIQQGEMMVVQPQYPVKVAATGIIADVASSWSRSLNSAKGSCYAIRRQKHYRSRRANSAICCKRQRFGSSDSCTIWNGSSLEAGWVFAGHFAQQD